MPHIEEIADVTVDADTPWRVVGSFQGVGEWHRMLASVQGGGEQPGVLRRVIGEDGSEQVERLDETDPARRWYRYAVESGALPVRDHRSQLHVQANSDGSTTARWVADFENSAGDPDETVGIVRGFLAAGVQSLAERHSR